MVSLWISHGGWQSHSKGKCHTPLRGNSVYSTHDHFCFCICQISHILSYYNWSIIRIIEHVSTYLFIDMMGGHPFQLYLPPEGTSFDHGTCMWLKCLRFFKLILTPKAPAVKNNSELGCSQAEGIDNPFFLLKWALGMKLSEQSMYWSFPIQFPYIQDWAQVSYFILGRVIWHFQYFFIFDRIVCFGDFSPMRTLVMLIIIII